MLKRERLIGNCKLHLDHISNLSHSLKRHKSGIQVHRSGPDVIKLFSCSTQLSTKYILLINIKMPTIVGISTFITMINKTSESLKARKVVIFSSLVFMSSCDFMLSWVEHEKSFITWYPSSKIWQFICFASQIIEWNLQLGIILL